MTAEPREAHPTAGLRDLVHQRARLGILTVLGEAERVDFPYLKTLLQLTDGNLCTHARKLHSAGLIAIDKQFLAGRPVTSLELTVAGRDAIEQHARTLLAVLDGSTSNSEPAVPVAAARADHDDEDWVD